MLTVLRKVTPRLLLLALSTVILLLVSIWLHEVGHKLAASTLGISGHIRMDWFKVTIPSHTVAILYEIFIHSLYSSLVYPLTYGSICPIMRV